MKGFDGNCATDPSANTLSDGVIQDNSFNSNGGGLAGALSPDYQVTIDSSAGWRFRGNGTFGSTGCGDLHMIGVGGTSIANNRFDISDNLRNPACPSQIGGGSIESILLEMEGSKTFTFASNNVVNVEEPDPGFPWDALKVVNDAAAPDCNSQGMVGSNGFAHRTGHFILNAIDYSGACASAMPLIAVGNAYNANVATPSLPNVPPPPAHLPFPVNVVTGTEQYLTMRLDGQQASST